MKKRTLLLTITLVSLLLIISAIFLFFQSEIWENFLSFYLKREF